jgi:hypothetical protein
VDDDYAELLVRRLIETIDQIEALLRAVGEPHWHDYLARSRREIVAHDAHGLRRLLADFGGIGSFTDLTLCAANGHDVPEGDTSVDLELARLRSQLYQDAFDLLLDFNRPTTDC